SKYPREASATKPIEVSSGMTHQLSRIRTLGRQSVNLSELDGEPTITDRRCYQVRLGETLRSVALRDPCIQDASIWPLIARINGLSIATNDDGEPIACLRKGQFIVLPTRAEIEEYHLSRKHSAPAESYSLVNTTGGAPLEADKKEQSTASE